MDLPVDAAFTKAFPKAELHAHLTGSISPACLHEIWKTKARFDLEDPLTACRPKNAHHDILSFFKLFDTYIYNLCNDRSTVAYTTAEVLKAFEEDGVRYLELRTTPRESTVTGLTKEIYIETVLDVINQHSSEVMSTYLILSIDRRNTLEQAMEIVHLAIKYQDRGIIGIDLCGDPLKGDISIFRPAFALAREKGLKITIHFAEVPESSTDTELRTLLSYEPDRLGHVINVAPDIEAIIEERKIGLELCLSCNVHAKLIEGGFANHHFRKWYRRGCPIALCTDDVVVFGSPLSNEYLLVSRYFGCSRRDLIELSRRSSQMLFSGEFERERLGKLIDRFQESIEHPRT
ncbi:unnamed protein product [Bemisia tabaci]|uniref:Adenosine deaminase domain-containing protein n=1 Tax=Bemisia tabaci TaxID=7038 RepID=A0A9P0AH76_BEMTA|nr:unnamed protein product [Bemisia tabaci]